MKRKREAIQITTFTPRQISQKRAEEALMACIPNEWHSEWVGQFRRQNEGLRSMGEQPLSASEFILCRLQDLCGAEAPF